VKGSQAFHVAESPPFVQVTLLLLSIKDSTGWMVALPLDHLGHVLAELIPLYVEALIQKGFTPQRAVSTALLRLRDTLLEVSSLALTSSRCRRSV